MKLIRNDLDKVVAQVKIGKGIAGIIFLIFIPFMMSSFCIVYSFYLFQFTEAQITDSLILLVVGLTILMFCTFILNAYYTVQDFIFSDKNNHLVVVAKGFFTPPKSGEPLSIREISRVEIECADAIDPLVMTSISRIIENIINMPFLRILLEAFDAKGVEVEDQAGLSVKRLTYTKIRYAINLVMNSGKSIRLDTIYVELVNNQIRNKSLELFQGAQEAVSTINAFLLVNNAKN